MNNIIKRVWNQNRMVNIEDLCGMAFQAESGGHTFEISGVDDTGAVVPLTGTVAGVFRRPDNADIALTGAASGGVASVTLTDDCYAVPGRFGLTIYTTADGQKTAVYAAVGTVAATNGGAVAGDTPQDVVDLINAIAAAIATIPADYTDLMAAIAPMYSNSALYAVGSYAWYDGDLCRCTTPITTAETWTAAHWTAAVLGNDLSVVRNTADNAYKALSIDEAPTWELGTINATTGANATSSNRIRTASSFVITPEVTVSVPSGAFVFLRPYTTDGTFTAYGTTKFTGTFNLVDTIGSWLASHPSVTKMRFVAGFLDDSSISDVSDLTITVYNPVPILSEAGFYLNKSTGSNSPAGFTFWRQSVDGYSTSNPFSPLDMPMNTYAVATGDGLTSDWFPDSVRKLSSNVYWAFKFRSTANVNLGCYMLFNTSSGAFFFGQTYSNSVQPEMKVFGGNNSPVIAFFGDSITRGINSDTSPSAWSDVNIPSLLCNELKCTVDNYGIGSIGWLENGGSSKGTAIEYLQRMGDSDWYWDGIGTYVNNKFIGNVKSWSDYNTVILAFGANDRAVNSVATTLGSLDDIDDTMTYAQVMAMTPSTIVEAMYQCYRYIREQAPTINIILSDPLMQVGGTAPWWSYPTRYSPSKWSWDELNEMYAAFAKRYGLGHISNYDAPINRVDPTVSLADNVHPTTACYRQLARHFAGKIGALV